MQEVASSESYKSSSSQLATVGSSPLRQNERDYHDFITVNTNRYRVKIQILLTVSNWSAIWIGSIINYGDNSHIPLAIYKIKHSRTNGIS